MPTRTLLLIRHAQYTNTQPDNLEPDGPLTPNGEKQVQLLVQRLHGVPLRAIFHSDTIRAAATAAPLIADHPNVITESTALLREAWAGMPDDPLLPQRTQAFLANQPAEEFSDGLARSQAIMERFFVPSTEDCIDVLVAHGNLIAGLVSQVLRAPWGAWLNADTRHTGISEVEIHDNGFRRLTAHGDVGHLPRNLYSF